MDSRTSEHSHERGHRTRHARTFLAVAFLLQRIGDVAVIWYTFHPTNTAQHLRGVAIGSALFTAVLLIGVWRRLRWARYVLTGVNWAYILLFSLWALKAWDQLKPVSENPCLALLAGVALYGGANVILLRSRRVRHFANL